jgi:hypothetical protein
MWAGAASTWWLQRPHRRPHGQQKKANCRQIALIALEMMTDDAKFALGF